MQTEATIIVKNISKKFKDQVVIKEISINFYPGKIYGIIGYNGSGKTVFLKCICGFLTSDSGEILINKKIIKKDMDILNDAGIIIEDPAFLKNYNGMKNLEFLYMINHKTDRNYLQEVLKKVGLNPLSLKKVKNYSLGMKQRLAIAQAIMEEPPILILDEPMNGLDKKGIADMRKLFLELKMQGKTILLASHNKDDINILCDEVYEMDEGVLISVKT